MKSVEELKALREKIRSQIHLQQENGGTIRVVVGMATCGIAAGARPVLDALVDEVSRRGLQNVQVVQTGCIGVCRLEPIVEVYMPGQERVTYIKMTEEYARRVVQEHLVNGQVVAEYTIGAAE